MIALIWAYWIACQLAGLVLFVLGIFVVGAASAYSAWTYPYADSIKPIEGRTQVDGWTWPINAIYGNPEDGVSGRYAFGPTWSGAFNPTGSRLKAFEWAGFRNWANGWNYLTWRSPRVPPLFIYPYRFFGGTRVLKLGWQQRYGRTVMVCSA